MAHTLEKIDNKTVKRTFTDVREETLTIADIKGQLKDLRTQKALAQKRLELIQARIDDLKATLVDANTNLGMADAVDPTP